MKFDLNKVLDEGCDSLVVRVDVDFSGVRLRGDTPFQSPVHMTASAVRRDGSVSLDCAYDFSLTLECDRCLSPFVKTISQQASHVVVRSLSGPDGGDFVVAPDGIVELDELATNDILPELPSQFLCRDDCRGLCPICGRNRNLSPCSCERRQADPRLEALRSLLDEKEE